MRTEVARRVGLATCSEHAALSDDDRPLVDLLASRGVEAVPLVWSEYGRAGDAELDAVVLRSTWDYVDHIEAFTAWFDELERSRSRVLNALDLLRWNVDKRYLLDLAARGASIVPSVVVEARAAHRIGEVLEERGWHDAIVKPTVACSAKGVQRVALGRTVEAEAAVAAAGKDVLVQPFDARVVDHGELSFVFLRGEFSHAVRKRPPPGDFRAQEHLGGITVLERSPSPELVASARATLATAPFPTPLYARVDGLEGDGRLDVMELELVEPLLYLALAPGAADRMADAIVAELSTDPRV